MAYMLVLDVLDDERRAAFVALVHEPAVGDRSRRAALIDAAGGELVRG